ncbi:IS5 family transposase [Lentibacillus salinarum]|uniref:IS5 family transposase n=1 Tax=Lentibacillus salinarum TaxID=446820 RepID=A0ABW3ZX44_9BACI
MYKMTENQLVLPEDFFLPFGGKLNKENRWVVLANLIPWWQFEEAYANTMKRSSRGQQAFSVRMALGALYIQQRKGLSDRDTVEEITENPYLQYFIGLPEFQEEAPFNPSMMTHFRKRLDADMINQLNEAIVMEELAGQSREDDDDQDDDSDDNDAPPSENTSSESADTQSDDQPANQGKLLLDATCTPADIAYPTDLGLLNEAREKLEHIIDVLHAPHRGKKKKPRTYRQKARKAYLSVAKQRKPKAKKMRKAIGKQLGFVERDLKIVSSLKEESSLSLLTRQEYKQLLVISELCRQQRDMYDKRSKRIDDRIVSISQPHVRPIVRGKAKAGTEFGAKVSVSLVNGYALMENLDWDNYNEGTTLQESAERYKSRFGHYPEAILADQIYRNRENRQYCKEKGIRLSGPALGRPSKEKAQIQKQLAKQDAAERNEIEGKFGEGKRHYGMGLIFARLQQTSETVISIQLLVMNLERRLRLLFYYFFQRFFGISVELKWAV